MNKTIIETTIQPVEILENGTTKYIYTVAEFEQATIEFMEFQGHVIDRDFAPDLIWAEDEFTDKYDFTMDYEKQIYTMEKEQ